VEQKPAARGGGWSPRYNGIRQEKKTLIVTNRVVFSEKSNIKRSKKKGFFPRSYDPAFSDR
jgi:hypothetical protein